MPITYKPTSKKQRSGLEWQRLRDEYVRRVAGGEDLTLHRFSKEHGLNYASLRQRSHKEGWGRVVEEYLGAHNNREISELRAAHETAMKRLRSMAVNEEVSVRARQANIGRELQSKALARFQSMASEELAPRDAIQMMRLGIDVEKNALGLSDKLEADHPLRSPHKEIERVAQESLRASDVDQMLVDVLEDLWKDKKDGPAKKLERKTTH